MDIFITLIQVSEKQAENFEDDIRIRAAKFFLTDFFPNTLAYFFGNGQHHPRSMYGQYVFSYALYPRYFQGDIGLIGDFSKYGLFFAIGALWLLFKAFRSPVNPEYFYIKYRLILYILVLPFSGFFSSPSAIAELCIFMYIIDNSIHELKEKSQDE